MVETALSYISLDTIPEIAVERNRVRTQAWKAIEFREQQRAAGNEHRLPLVVDALSTAESVLEARDEYGAESQEYQERREGLKLDSLRLVAEWYRKKRPEYFPPSRHFFDADTGDFFSHGLSIRQMTENALRPIDGNPEEEARRVNERVENETPYILQKVGSVAMAGMGIRTISECTDKAIADYQTDVRAGSPHRGYDGYVPEIEKIMIRDIRIDPVSGDRFEEQVGIPGTLISHFVIQQALLRQGIEAGEMNKTQLHATQLLVNDDLMEFVRLLDESAAEEWRSELRQKTVFMGEEVPLDMPKDYTNFRKEALQRQENLTEMAEKVVMLLLDLAEINFDRHKAPMHVENFVKKLLLDKASQDSNIALDIFDQRTADGLYEVRRLQAEGQNSEAFRLLQRVEEAAPGGGYCGAGSCGLESIDEKSVDGKRLKEALKAEKGDTVLKDKERQCKCGSRNIVYAYNKDKVNKYCDNCKSFESKRTTGRAKV